VSTLIGIELNKEAVLDAERNAAANGFSTDIASFHSVDLNTKKTNNALELLDLPNPDIIVVDPPRAGKWGIHFFVFVFLFQCD
jgi:tRNA/tmRNA/rRNA uracil-C5-methylase (TrmA/RlmC/RlmD family)